MCEPEDVPHAEALRLVAQGAVRLLDVRTPAEYATLGHIPGAQLLPVSLIASAPAVLPRDGRPVLVYCEHGIRSTRAALLLAQAGEPRVLTLADGLAGWTGPREFGPEKPVIAGPSSWLLECADLLPRSGDALDVACGAGRHALLLAAAGLRVHAVDREAATVARLREVAARLALPVRAEVMDLETQETALPEAAYDLVLVVSYLHRPLFPALVRALRPGGLLVYETFTTAQAAHGKPTNPAFLLQPGELPRLAAPLRVVREREGEIEGRHVAGIAALAPLG